MARTHLAYKAEHAVDWRPARWSPSPCKAPTKAIARRSLKRPSPPRNILKRLLIHAGGFNLALVMRFLIGSGTPRGLQGLPSPITTTIGNSSAATHLHHESA